MKEKLKDDEVLELLQKKLQGKNLWELSTEKQRLIMKEIKALAGVRNRQFARITGIGFNIIRRL